MRRSATAFLRCWCRSDIEEGESRGLPVWGRHVGDPIVANNRTRRVDFAPFTVHALTSDALVREAPAIVGRLTPSAIAKSMTLVTQSNK